MKKRSLHSFIASVAVGTSYLPKHLKVALLAFLFCVTGYNGFANVSVTAASGGTGICSNTAATGVTPAYTTLGAITVTEGATTDLSNGVDQLILTAPSGWQFNTGSLPTFSFVAGRNISSISGSITSSTLTINISVAGTSAIDQFTISGLMVEATTTAASPGYVYASLGAGLLGITPGATGTDFADLSLTGAVTPSVTVSASPGSTICAGTGVTFTPIPTNGGASPSYQWFLNGAPVATGVPYFNSTLSTGNTVSVTLTSSASCLTTATASSAPITMTVNPLPATVTASGGGTFCGSTTITAANGGSGTIYFQGTTSGGTSTATPSASQVVASSGTYYFRAQSASGCWGTEGSVTVTINPLPASTTVSGAGTYCGNATLTATGGAGGTIYFQNTTTGGTSIATPSSSQTVASSGTYYFRAQSAAGCWGTEGSATVTINPNPAAVTASGGGTFCGSTTITAAGGAGGTIYFQGTTTGGTSTATASTSQLVSASGTYYFRAQTAAGCWGTEGSVTVTINPVPTAVTVSGAGTYCGSGTLTATGGTGGTIYFQNTTTGGTSTATPSSSQTVASSGTYYFRAQSIAGCWGTEGSAAVVVNPLPTTVTASGGGTFCGNTTITAANGGSGTIYFQGTTSGGTSTATPSASQSVSTSGTYYFRAQSAAGCWGTEGSVTVTINPLPTAVTVSGAGTYCGSGTLTATGGTGGSIYFQNNTTGGTSTATPSSSQVVASSGTYYFRAQTALGCWGTEGSAAVVINPLPTAVTASGAGTFCGSTTITAANGGSGTIYFQGTSTGGTSTATPSVSQSVSASGTYYFRAQSAAGCWGTEGSVAVTINPLPTAYGVTGGGSYCSGGTGVAIGLANSATGVNYQLLLAGVPTGSPVAGSTGSAITFGLQITAGTYTVRATDAVTGCNTIMTGSATVTVLTLPTASAVNGGGNFCLGGTGVAVGLAGSQSGVNYQLYLAGTPTGSAVAGTGAGITFGLQTGAGTYTAVGTNTVTGCASNMIGSVTVTVNPLPFGFSVTGGGSYCSGGAGVAVGLSGSTSGINYQLFRGVTTVGAPFAGTGSSLAFGAQTVAGTYTVVATNATTGCTSNMTSSAVVTINPLPTAYSVTGGGAYCFGGSGVSVGLTTSDAGINYQLFRGATTVGGALPGTGSSLDFGLQTVAGTYTVVATNATTGCTNGMTSSATVAINPLPLTFAMSGGGVYCSGGTGVAIGLLGSVSGTNYQLFRGATSVGSAVAGTGGAITFGLQTVAGTYTAIATNTVTLCTNAMTGSATISINPLPTTYGVTGGGALCSGGTGVDVGLSNSDFGVTYQLLNGGVPVGATMAGNGAALDFGLQTTAGIYTISATIGATGCTTNMTGSVTVIVNPLPTPFAVTGGGGYCTGGTGVTVGLAGSVVGTSYQLLLAGAPVGSPVAGTSSAISFGLQTVAGTYSVRATNTTTGCTNTMTGTVTITINPLPTTFSVTGGGNYCAGGAGKVVGLSSSALGISYQLYVDGIATGGAVAGTGAAITFGSQTSAGSYTVIATNTTTFCTSNMTGSVTVAIDPVPAAFTVTGGGVYCFGGAGVSVGLNGSVAGISYQLSIGGVATGTPMAGTGSALDFGLQTATGIATIVGTNVATGCTSNMVGSVTISTNPLPGAFSVTGGGSYCLGGVGLHVGLGGSVSGISYQLYNGFTATGAPMAGTGSALDFGLQLASGFYTIVATNSLTGCSATMTSGVAITILPLPVTYAITGGGAYCAGGTGVSVGLANSASGVNYQLYWGATPVGLPVSGTGLPLDFGMQTTAGTYTVIANDVTTTCVNNMSGSAIVSINPIPNVFIVTGGGVQCAGGAGVAVGLSGSQIGINYQLRLAGVPVGSPVAGTSGVISFGLQTASGVYTVVASSAAACTSNMTGSVTVTINPLPVAFSVTGGGHYCSGGTGMVVGLSNSEMGVDYTLFVAGAPVGSTVSGTGGAISFGLQTTGGTYSIVGLNTTTGCSGIMTGTVDVTVDPLPSPFAVTGGGNYCAGGTGVVVGLFSSEVGVVYQLANGGVATGATVTGTGSAISFGLQTAGGSYTVSATNATTACFNNMTGAVTVTINPTPNSTYSVTGTGSYCFGGAGLAIGLSGSDLGINYQLFDGTTPVGASVAGTGGAITFGTFGTATTYTVMATDATTGCTATMTGSAVISINPLPSVFSYTGGGSFCAGGTGIVGILSGSQIGVDYQEFVSGVPTATTTPGTGSPLFLVDNAGGLYTMMATDATTGCTSTMSGSFTVTVNPLPAAIAGSSNVCLGSSVMLTDASGTGTWSSSDAAIASIDASGNVSGLATGTAVITYVLPTGCMMTSVETVSPLPVVAAITGPSAVCDNGTMTLTSATAGGVWSSSNAAVATNDAAGTIYGVASGTIIVTYTVTSAALCVNTDTAIITVNPSPVVAAITGATRVCANLSTTLADATSGGVWTSSDATVATVNASGVVSAFVPGTVTLTYTYTNTFGCSNSVNYLLSVGDTMAAASITPASKAIMCHGNPVTLTVTTAATTLTYQWTLAGTDIPGEISSTYTATVTGFYSVTIDNGTCSQVLPGVNVVPQLKPVVAEESVTHSLYTGSYSTYQWYLNGTPIVGATSDTYFKSGPGSYVVIVSDGNGCFDTSLPYIDTTIVPNGVTKVKNTDAIRIYPNPVSSVLHIEATEKVMVSIVSPDGRILMDRKEAVTINVGQLANGVYMLMIYDDNGQLLKTERFVKVGE